MRRSPSFRKAPTFWLKSAEAMRDLDDLFAALARSSFRNRFRLRPADRTYALNRTRAVILEHGRDFIRQRLAPAQPKNDGKQTPMRGHPIFVGQHATATCCRKCLEKWHRITANRPLSDEETDYLIRVLARWLDHQLDWSGE